MEIIVNGESQRVEEALSLTALLEQLAVKPERVAVQLNDDIVRRDAWPAIRLQSGDRVEVVHFVGGGSQLHS